MYGPFPPDGAIVTDPSQTPLQEIGATIVKLAAIAAGSVTTILSVSVHPFASVTVTV